MKPIQEGFTLIEMLVVLIITAMVSAVLFQALERSYGLQRRFGQELFKTQQGQMAVDWYRQTMQGIYPDYPDGKDVFRGDASSLSGLTTTSLDDNYGAPVPFQWTLNSAPGSGRTDLIYRQNGQEATILNWQGADAKFVYFDRELVAHDKWPPPLGLFTQLPKQVQIEAMDRGERISILVTLVGPTEPPARPDDLFNIRP